MRDLAPSSRLRSANFWTQSFICCSPHGTPARLMSAFWQIFGCAWATSRSTTNGQDVCNSQLAKTTHWISHACKWSTTHIHREREVGRHNYVTSIIQFRRGNRRKWNETAATESRPPIFCHCSKVFFSLCMYIFACACAPSCESLFCRAKVLICIPWCCARAR